MNAARPQLQDRNCPKAAYLPSTRYVENAVRSRCGSAGHLQYGDSLEEGCKQLLVLNSEKKKKIFFSRGQLLI